MTKISDFPLEPKEKVQTQPLEFILTRLSKIRRICEDMATEEKQLIFSLEQFGYFFEPTIEVASI
ncbi:MAG: hypothetical protein RSD67_05450 [Oscillospiraceae bacterium]